MRTHEENLEYMITRYEYVDSFLNRVIIVETEAYTRGESKELEQFVARRKEAAKYIDSLKLATDGRRARFLDKCRKLEEDIEAYVYHYEIDINDEDYD